ncbi:hypothetical protein GGR57DRAFT_500249 [Xylariaceae sp. FL1272]|nr:hypothetical protein GGR57DRAFT_500249 [Xylariaceae sp. FL1272]
MAFRHSSDPGPGVAPEERFSTGPSSTADTLSPLGSISRLKIGSRKFSLSRRRYPAQTEDTWGSYGLNLIHEPHTALIDLIFVHGLRGGSIKTWCKDDDLQYFWPGAWLPREQDLQYARIHSFGYNADWADTKETTMDLHDFGQVTNAYILAQQEPKEHQLASRIQCMFFLATPHRGSDSAKLLNNILKASTILSSRQYIADIFKGSSSLQIINDEFRAYTDRLHLWTFYETLKTRVSATSSVLIVDRDSAVLGYRGEIAQPLNADHRSICKFDSFVDPNYITIRNSLSKATEDLLGDVLQKRAEQVKSQIGDLESFLVISSNAEDDLMAAESSKTNGTCEWAVQTESFEKWRDSEEEKPMLYVLTGEPGSGKSIVASHVIRHLQGIGADVCYHFFRHGRKSQQSTNGFLRQIAYQMALIHPSVCESLNEVQSSGMAFDKDDERALWRKLFTNEILKLPLQPPQYWIIDGLDECVDVPKLFALITRFDSVFPIRFYFVSRKRLDFERYFSKFDSRFYSHHIESAHTLGDIRLFLIEHATSLPVSDEDSNILIDRIVKKSRGIFLWAILAVEELEQAYSDESIDEILDEMPEGMAPIYTKILETMANNTREMKLTRAILTWAICGVRPLKVTELQASLKLDLGTQVKNMERSVAGLCGQLLHVDKSGTINSIHNTVREFLVDSGLDSPFAMSKEQSHHRLALICLQYLVSEDLRPPRSQHLVQAGTNAVSAFADYACTSFSEHIMGASARSDDILQLLCKFFRTNVLSWIEYVARRKRDLYHVIRAARNLRNYLDRRSKYTSPLCDDYRLVEKWTTDLIRIMAKFSRNLLQFPSAIFYLVAPLCPKDSAIYHQFGDVQHNFRLYGAGDTDWDDCISYIDYRGIRALSLDVGDTSFAIGQKSGHIKLYHTATCQAKATLTHGEPVKFLKLDHSGSLLLASGNRRLSMFHTDGELLWTTGQVDPVVTATFSEDDEVLAVATKGTSVFYFNSLDGHVLPGSSLGRPDCTMLKSTTRQAILHADISPDLKVMAIAYRGRPVQLWSLEKDVSIGVCWFSRDTPGTFCLSISEVLFNRNPAVELLAVASQDGELAIFDYWTQQELKSVSGEAYTLACTSDGRTLATGDMLGTIKLWDFDTLTLLYCIKSDDYEVRSLAFGSGGYRVYDIRDTKTKVWEPSALVRKSLSDESSISESVAHAAPVVHRVQEITDIMELAAVGTEGYVLAGRENGSVALFDTTSAKLQSILYGHRPNVSVNHICWCPGGYIATTDASSVVQVWTTRNTVKMDQKVLDIKLSDGIRSISFNPTGSNLLVCGSSSDTIYQMSKVQNRFVTQIRCDKGDDLSNHIWAWLPARFASCDIVLISDSTISFFQVDEAACKLVPQAKATLTYRESRLPAAVRKMSLDKTSKYIALEWAPTRDTSLPNMLLYDLADLQQQTESLDFGQPLHLKPKLELLSTEVRVFIGWREQTVIFLDADLWICSIDMASIRRSSPAATTYTTKRHFFIPYELIGSSNGVTPLLASDSSVVFPREGALAIVSNAFSTVFTIDEKTEG